MKLNSNHTTIARMGTLGGRRSPLTISLMQRKGTWDRGSSSLTPSLMVGTGVADRCPWALFGELGKGDVRLVLKAFLGDKYQQWDEVIVSDSYGDSCAWGGVLKEDYGTGACRRELGSGAFEARSQRGGVGLNQEQWFCEDLKPLSFSL